MHPFDPPSDDPTGEPERPGYPPPTAPAVPTDQLPVTPPSGSEPPPWPGAPVSQLPDAPEESSAKRSRGWLRPALAGALAGAVSAALVGGGLAVALDDDGGNGRSGITGTPITTETGTLDIQGILAKVEPSVVAIETSQSSSDEIFGAGSGIVISEDGYVLTNAHVIRNLGGITVVLPDGTRRPATLVGSSPTDDLALIQVDDAEGLVPAELGSSDDLRVGDEVIAIGNALNLGSEPTVTRGIVSAKDRTLDAEGVTLEGLIQTDAAINPGNSGGPLVNAAGQVVGMNTAIVADAQNLGFAIAIDRARPIIEELEAGDGEITPDQAFLGVSTIALADVTPAVLDRYGIDPDAEGVLVNDVVDGSGADEAGIRTGDLIVGIDGEATESPNDVRDAVVSLEPGDEVEIRLVRDGEELTVEATLGRRGDNA